ncbi:hypothetical protein [Leptolyngbya sp. NK1-12]|nr:hypothetical protein [Leptolyngbya sp. NK1-12]
MTSMAITAVLAYFSPLLLYTSQPLYLPATLPALQGTVASSC